MKLRTISARTRAAAPAAIALGLLALVPLSAFAQQAPGGGNLIQREKSVTPIAQGKWTGKRLADGQPDIQGFWSNTIANHNNFTDPQGGTPGDRGERGPKGKREDRAPSRVSDPADGQVPFQPWARAVQEDLRKNFVNPTKPEYIEPFARCAPGGIPKSFFWHGYEIRQYPGYVLFLFNSGWRIVHLDGKPALADNIKLWNADSRGHWEGNTLVVEVSNNNSKARFGRSAEFASENVKIEERYIFDAGGERYNYVATFTDPSVYTRPWTTTIPARRYTEKDTPDGWHFEARLANNPGKPAVAEYEERICVENNGEFGHVAATGVANALPSTNGAPPLINR
jgi:hypothetical protein